MKVRLSFDTFFETITGIDSVDIDIPEGSTVGDAVDVFLSDKSEIKNKMNDKKLFLLGDLRAIYHIAGTVVKKDHPLTGGDNLKILKAFIGG
ncbi:MAG: hypothetical protein PQJ61_13360 [Spirochaetales bacterium]|uniref:MoaD/ThiS family protein n=1 Tax=Candidatus Thalassospirochaeta sargassi TaxID=3119039 RepID=A0AAJ1MLC9_9SPIO|nr:hypothetical protein [Spirochaetales bacterium]